jgi:hypothetical protein
MVTGILVDITVEVFAARSCEQQNMHAATKDLAPKVVLTCAINLLAIVLFYTTALF